MCRVKKAVKVIQDIDRKCWQKSMLIKRKLVDMFEKAEDPENSSYEAGRY